MLAFAPPPPAGTGFAHAFPSVLTPTPAWTPELDGFSSIDPNYESSSPASSTESAASPTPWSSPLTTPTTLQLIGQNEPRVSISANRHSPAFEFDGMTMSPMTEQSAAHSSFAQGFRPADLSNYDAFPASVMKRPSVSYPGLQPPSADTGNPGLGFYLPANYAPEMPADERFLLATADGRLPPSGRLLADDSWTAPFSTIRLSDRAPAQTWSFV